eukprot:scaffold7018_cov71-Attheya_sp.AAC.3
MGYACRGRKGAFLQRYGVKYKYDTSYAQSRTVVYPCRQVGVLFGKANLKNIRAQLLSMIVASTYYAITHNPLYLLPYQKSRCDDGEKRIEC